MITTSVPGSNRDGFALAFHHSEVPCGKHSDGMRVIAYTKRTTVILRSHGMCSRDFQVAIHASWDEILTGLSEHAGLK